MPQVRPKMWPRTAQLRCAVARRIAELQTRNERKAEMAAMTRDELVKILTEIVQATPSRMAEARPADGLKAAEMLVKMCGWNCWNEPERQQVQHIHLQVDSALIEELRAGHAEMNALGSGSSSAQATLPAEQSREEMSRKWAATRLWCGW
jgi:hypothetical protein